ncbi:MAG: MlrC domain protein [Candidatus Latescibacteria bacterium]|nr:MlrC domain protein [Candidatus Latescibacterota bacterium]
MRIATGCIGHETNTFSPVSTTMEHFGQSYYEGGAMLAAFAGTSTITGGFIAGGRDLDLELVPLLWTFATPSGAVEEATYEQLKERFLQLLQEAGPIDGVCLDLHGAMVSDHHQDAEGDLLASVRQAVGDIPVISTLDLHANITAQMASQVEALVGFDTYPHVDCYDRGLEAITLLHATVEGRIRPTQAYRQLPLLTAPPAQCTMHGPMLRVLEKLQQIESRPEVATATISMGFPFADIADAGVSLLVTTNGDQDLAEQYADEFAAFVWDMRGDFNRQLVSVEEALEQAGKAAGKPVVLAEGADNPGGGGPCDGTHILRPLIEADFQGAVVAVIADPEAVGQAIAAGVGQEVDLLVGGKTIPLHGEPVVVRAYVKTISDGRFVLRGPMGRGKEADMGRAVVVAAGGVEIILTEERIQPFDAEVLRCVGIDPQQRQLIALKSAVHFRADFTPIAHEILEVETPGIHSPNLFSYDYQRLRRPMYPLDQDVEWGPG